MAKGYSKDLRERAVAMVQEGDSRREVARVLDLAPSAGSRRALSRPSPAPATIARRCELRRNGCSISLPRARSDARGNPRQARAREETHRCSEFGLALSTSTGSRSKKVLHAAEEDWWTFPHGHWKTLTLVAACRVEGVTAPYVVDGAMDGPAFLVYVSQVLVPTLRKTRHRLHGQRAHAQGRRRPRVEAAGAELRYLPPYSPGPEPDRERLLQAQVGLRQGAARTVDATAAW